MNDDVHELRIEATDTWSERAAELLATAVTTIIERRERCLLALSGGPAAARVNELLGRLDLRWERVVVLQTVDRVVWADHPDRYLTAQRTAFADLGVTWLPLPVDRLLDAEQDQRRETERDPLEAVFDEFTARLIEFADEPPVVDVVQLCVEPDGHTAGLFSGDSAVGELRRYLAITTAGARPRHLTMTRPVLDRARVAIWLASGQAQAPALGRLLAGDLESPAGLLRPRQSVVVADTDAARQA